MIIYEATQCYLYMNEKTFMLHLSFLATISLFRFDSRESSEHQKKFFSQKDKLKNDREKERENKWNEEKKLELYIFVFFFV